MEIHVLNDFTIASDLFPPGKYGEGMKKLIRNFGTVVGNACKKTPREFPVPDSFFGTGLAKFETVQLETQLSLAFLQAGNIVFHRGVYTPGDTVDELFSRFPSFVDGILSHTWGDLPITFSLYSRVAIFYAPFIVLEDGILRLQIPRTSTLPDAVGKAMNSLPSKMYTSEKLDCNIDFGTIFDLTADANRVPLQHYVDAVMEAKNKNFKLTQKPLDIWHMIGAMLGGIFAQTIINCALCTRDGTNVFLDVTPTGNWDPVANLSERITRICMLASAHNMVNAGILMFSRMKTEEIGDQKATAVYTLALYLVHIALMGHLRDRTSTKTPALADAASQDEAKDWLQDVKDFKVDLSPICEKSLQAAIAFSAGFNVADLKAKFTDTWIQDKFDAVLVSAVSTYSGLAIGGRLAEDLYKSIAETLPTATFNITSIIYGVIYCLDHQQTADARSTHLFAAFSTDGYGGGWMGGDALIMSISGDIGDKALEEDAELLEGKRSAKTASFHNPLLGSILLDSSEHHLISSSRGSALLESGEDGGMSSLSGESSPSAHQTSGKQQSSKSGSSSGSKGQFKKVQAKML